MNETKIRALVAREIARALKATGKIDPRFLGAVAALLAERILFEIADDGSIAAHARVPPSKPSSATGL